MPQITPEDGAERLLKHFDGLARYWAEHRNGKDDLELLRSLVFSMLVVFDGDTDLPAFNLQPNPHPDDKAYHKSRGEDWWTRTPVNRRVELHGLWSHLVWGTAP